MKNLRSQIVLGLFLFTSIIYYSCRKDNKNNPELNQITSSRDSMLNIAKSWYDDNSALPSSGNGIDIKAYHPNWKKFTIDTNSAGLKVISIQILPLQVNLKQKKAFSIEMSVMVDKDGIPQGMIKEYMGYPFIGESKLNLYTGSGRLFMSGTYRADTRELKPNPIYASGFTNGKASARGMTDPDGNGGTLEEVVIVGTPPTSPPIYIPGNPNPPVNPGIPVSPGLGGGGGSGGGPGNGNTGSDIIDSLQNFPCAQTILSLLPYLKNDIAQKINTTFNNNCDIHVKFVPYKFIEEAPNQRPDGDARSKITFTNGYNYDAGYTLESTIRINEDVLNYSTKEYILATMYHETLHSFLSAEKQRLRENNAFYTTYPDVNPYLFDYKGRIDITQGIFVNDHTRMGINFVNGLSAAIKSFNNNIDQSTADALASAGIFKVGQGSAMLNSNERDVRNGNYTGTKCP